MTFDTGRPVEPSRESRVVEHGALVIEKARQGMGGPNRWRRVAAGALGLLRSPRYRHPFYWAGFAVIGDDAPLAR
jgi:hypothetical protein